MRPFPERWLRAVGGCADESGSAVVEFVMLGALLLVPVVYFVLTVGSLQGASFAAVGAADHAAKLFAQAPDPISGRAAAEAAVDLAMADFGMEAATAGIHVSCDRERCLDAGTAVTVSVEVDVPLPFAPTIGGSPPAVGRLNASATQIVGRFR